MSDRVPPPPATEQPVAEATHACILAIGLDHLVAAAQYDGYLAAILDDYRRLKAEDIGQRQSEELHLGAYYTPHALIELAAGSGNFLTTACEGIVNPPYGTGDGH